MAFTSYGRDLLLRCTFLNGSRLTTVYFALTSAVPSSSDDGTLLVEPSAAEYARQTYVLADNFTMIAPGEIGNNSVVSFPTPQSDWGMVRGWAMCTTSDKASGLVIASGPLRQPRRASAGSALAITIDAIRLGLRG